MQANSTIAATLKRRPPVLVLDGLLAFNRHALSIGAIPRSLPISVTAELKIQAALWQKWQVSMRDQKKVWAAWCSAKEALKASDPGNYELLVGIKAVFEMRCESAPCFQLSDSGAFNREKLYRYLADVEVFTYQTTLSLLDRMDHPTRQLALQACVGDCQRLEWLQTGGVIPESGNSLGLAEKLQVEGLDIASMQTEVAGKHGISLTLHCEKEKAESGVLNLMTAEKSLHLRGTSRLKHFDGPTRAARQEQASIEMARLAAAAIYTAKCAEHLDKSTPEQLSTIFAGLPMNVKTSDERYAQHLVEALQERGFTSARHSYVLAAPPAPSVHSSTHRAKESLNAMLTKKSAVKSAL